MLSFMKENGASSIITDGGSGFSDQGDILVPANSGKNVKQTTIILMVLFTVGAGCLWFMIKKTAPDSAQAAAGNTEELRIEMAIAQLTGIKKEMSKDMSQIVDQFNQHVQIDQVAVSDLKKNPFRQEIGVEVPGTNSDEFNRNKMAVTRERVNKEAQELQLLSLMANGDNGCCMINDKLLYVGDSINNFKIVAIHAQSLDLISDGVKVTIRMP